MTGPHATGRPPDKRKGPTSQSERAETSEAGNLWEKHSTALARCVVCGGHWRRPSSMLWATRCPECFRWARAYAGIRAAARALRGEVMR